MNWFNVLHNNNFDLIFQFSENNDINKPIHNLNEDYGNEFSTPLSIAIKMNNLNLVQFLIQKCNANIFLNCCCKEVSKYKYQNFNAIEFTAYKKRFKIFKLLLDNYPEFLKNQKLLYIICEYAPIKYLHYIIEQTIDVYEQFDCETLLIELANIDNLSAYKYCEIAELLLINGPKTLINRQDQNGNSALMSHILSISKNYSTYPYLDVFHIFKTYNIDINLKNKKGQNAFLLACKINCEITLNYLLTNYQSFIDVNDCDFFGNNALILSLKSSIKKKEKNINKEVILILLDHDINIDHFNKKNQNAFEILNSNEIKMIKEID